MHKVLLFLCFIQWILSPLAYAQSEIVTSTSDQKLTEKLDDLGKSALDEGSKTLSFGLEQAGDSLNEAGTEIAVLLSVAFVIVVVKIIIGTLMIIGKKLLGKNLNKKCMLYPTDAAMVTAAAVHIKKELEALEKFGKKISELVKKISDEISCMKGELSKCNNSENEFMAYLSDPVFKIILRDKEGIKDSLDANSSNSSDGGYLKPFSDRKTNFIEYRQCIRDFCNNLFENDGLKIYCRDNPHMQAINTMNVSSFDDYNSEVEAEFENLESRVSQNIPEYDEHVDEIKRTINQITSSGLGIIRIYEIVVDMFEVFLGFEEDRGKVLSLVRYLWLGALGLSIAKPLIPQTRSCFSWPGITKIFYLTTVSLIFQGYPGNIKIHEADNWKYEFIDMAKILEKNPLTKDGMAVAVKEYQKFYDQVKKETAILQEEIANITNNPPPEKIEKDIGQLIVGLIPFHRERLQTIKDRIVGLEAFSEKIKGVKGTSEEVLKEKLVMLRKVRDEFINNIKDGKSVLDKKGSDLINGYDANMVPSILEVEKVERIPCKYHEEGESDAPFKPMYFSPDIEESSQPNVMLLEKILRKLSSIENIISFAQAKLPKSTGCFNQKLGVDNKCTCRKTKSCLELNYGTKDLSTKQKKLLSLSTRSLNGYPVDWKVVEKMAKVNEQKVYTRLLKKFKVPLKKSSKKTWMGMFKKIFAKSAKSVNSEISQNSFLKKLFPVTIQLAGTVFESSAKVIAQSETIEMGGEIPQKNEKTQYIKSRFEKKYRYTPLHKKSQSIWKIITNRHWIKIFQ